MLLDGGVSRVAKGADCKSAVLRLRRFESFFPHHPASRQGASQDCSLPDREAGCPPKPWRRRAASRCIMFTCYKAKVFQTSVTSEWRLTFRGGCRTTTLAGLPIRPSFSRGSWSHTSRSPTKKRLARSSAISSPALGTPLLENGSGSAQGGLAPPLRLGKPSVSGWQTLFLTSARRFRQSLSRQVKPDRSNLVDR